MWDQYLKSQQAKQLLEKLTNGRSVPAGDLEYVLGPERWSHLMMEIGGVQERRALHRPVPVHVTNAVRRYTAVLSVADRLDSQANQRSQAPSSVSTPATRWKAFVKGLRSGGRRYQSKRIRAERVYESAIEVLQEVMEEFPEIVQYLDRHPIFEGDGCNVTPDPAGVPRMRYSRSRYLQRQSLSNETIKSLKQKALMDLVYWLELT